MRVVFCIYDFATARLPLQPWLTVRLVAEGLARRGHSVHLVSDVAQPAQIAGCESHAVRSLRGTNGAEIRRLLARVGTDALVFLPTPLNIVTTSWLDHLECRRIGLASYPFFRPGELLTAARYMGWTDSRQYLRHLVVPEGVWGRALRRRLDAVISQSATTATRLRAVAGRPESIFIPPGIQLSEWPYALRRDRDSGSPLRLLYLGAATRIRGFDIALDAVARAGNGVHLRVLARGADAARVGALNEAVVRKGVAELVEIDGGWMDRPRLVSEIHASDIVLQPFLLVPSELPVTAMEVIACGTPVIGSAIDGLPSTIGPAGTVVPACSATALAAAIARFAESAQVRAAWEAGCRQQREAMVDWETVTERWEDVLRG